MARLASIRNLYGQLGDGSTAPQTQIQNTSASTASSTPALAPIHAASGGNPYDSASTGRRLASWQPTRLGPTTNLWGTHDLSVARCRDVVRNNPWAASAVDNFESQTVGKGIRPRWNGLDPATKLKIEKEWRIWATSDQADFDGLLNFYGLQALASREIFEAGEVFSRKHTTGFTGPAKSMRVPLRIQMIESEQVPIFLNNTSMVPGVIPSDNMIRTGIEFDGHDRVAYHMYREHPGETMFYPMGGLQFIRVPAEQIEHTYKPLRAGQLRGQTYLSSGMLTLYELDKYTDAAVVKKQIQTMFCGFIEKIEPTSDILPNAMLGAGGTGLPNPPIPYSNDPAIEFSKLETGTMQVLLPGEKITFPQLPQDNDIETFMRVMLHRFAISVGATYEQLTGDLRGVNYSSIRAGLLDFRRKCEQFQTNILIRRFCQPIAMAWLREAVLEGTLDLPDYNLNPGKYADISWQPPRWDWVDPLKDVQAAQMAVRNGFTTKTAICAELGDDAGQIDAETAEENRRSDELGLIRDSDPRKVLIGRESNPDVPAPGDPDDKAAKEEEQEAESDEAGSEDTGAGL